MTEGRNVIRGAITAAVVCGLLLAATTADAAQFVEAGGGSVATAQVIDFAQDGLGLVSHAITGGIGGDAGLIQSGLITTEFAPGNTHTDLSGQQLSLTGTAGGAYVYTTHNGGGGSVDPAATQFTNGGFRTAIGGQIDNDRGAGVFEEIPYGAPLTIGAGAGPNIFLEWHEVGGADHDPSITFGYDVLDITNATHRTDFFRLENLLGGSSIDVEVLTDESTYGFFDSRLTFYDSAGTQQGSFDGDAGVGAHERLTGINVPGNGVLIVEVNNSKADDGIVGTYDLALSGTASFSATLEVQFNRDDGTITLNNGNPTPTEIKVYSIRSPVGALVEANYESLADAGRPGWVQLTTPGATGDLSEAHLTTDSIAGGASILLDDGVDGSWLRYFDETDISFQYLDAGGNLVIGSVAFTGNGGTAFETGDLDLDGNVDIADWTEFKSNFGSSSLTGLSTAEAYFASDFDGNGAHDLADAVAFRNAYDAANGVGAFVGMIASVPEPTSVALAGLGLGTLLMVVRGRPTIHRLSLCTVCQCSADSAAGKTPNSGLRLARVSCCIWP